MMFLNKISFLIAHYVTSWLLLSFWAAGIILYWLSGFYLKKVETKKEGKLAKSMAYFHFIVGGVLWLLAIFLT